MKKTPKKIAGKKASELIIKCDKLEEWNTLRSQFATTDHLENEMNNNLKSQFATSRNLSMMRYICLVPV